MSHEERERRKYTKKINSAYLNKMLGSRAVLLCDNLLGIFSHLILATHFSCVVRHFLHMSLNTAEYQPVFICCSAVIYSVAAYII